MGFKRRQEVHEIKTREEFERVFGKVIPFAGFSVPIAHEIYNELSSSWIQSQALRKFVTYLGQELKARGVEL